MGNINYGGRPTIEEQVIAMREFTKEITSGPDAREKCTRFLIDAGILDESGELSELYRRDPVYGRGFN